MAEIVNLRLARKRRKREEAEAVATRNRVAHGTPKAVSAIEAARRDLDRRRLDAHALDCPKSDTD